MMTHAPSLALFDLDNTLLPLDSDHGWSQFLIDIGVLDKQAFEEKNDYFYAQYKAGTLNIFEFLDFQLKPLAMYSLAELKTWHARYMAEVITPNIRPQALALVQKHRDAGHECVVVTATNSFITRPIVDRFGIQSLIATEPEFVDGRYTGKVVGTPSFREGKVTRMEQWLADRGQTRKDFDSVYFYSDSINDLALLEWSTHAVAANPDARLRALATEKGWPVLELFAQGGATG